MSLPFPSPLSDAEARRRFRAEIERDFSVTAPAGVGKTHALVERIATLADLQPQRLPGLVVITYTKKAANSLKQRMYERLRHGGDAVRTLLNQSFFGTIHSYCWQLIQKFEETPYELLKNDADVRERFLGSLNLEEPDFVRFQNLFRFLDVDELLDVIKGDGSATDDTDDITSEGVCIVDPSEIFNFQPQRNDRRVLVSIEAVQRSLKEWLSLYQNTQRPLELPACEKGGEEFKTVFYETFRPFYEWLSSKATECGRLLKERYATFRRERGYVTYEDCILLARQCLHTEEAQTFYRQRPLSILLDEAQDTDRAQFDFLQTLMALHPNSHFSMVGDPQQSIYGDRADVRYYVNLHQSLVQSKRCEELVFSETFRCPPGVVSELNVRFPKIFRDPNGKQVSYVPLTSALKNDGCVKEVIISSEIDDIPSKTEASALEARKIADFLTIYLKQKPQNLSGICLLAPRKEWLTELKPHLEAFGWKVQLHSEQTTGRDNALFCNVLAAFHCIHFPQDTFEEAGLLHETFGCSDEALAYVFNSDRMQSTNDAEPLKGDYSEESGHCVSAIDDLFGGQLLYASEQQSNFSILTDVQCKIPSQHILKFPLNAHITEDVKTAQDIRSRWRQTLEEISEQSLCAGTVRLIEFFKSLVPSMPTDAYFEEILLETAFQTQQVGQSWLALEERLRVHLNETAETEEEIQSDALQGFSCHKAKGLEWATVIMPFFDRPVRYQTPHYPCLYRGKILWNKKDAEASEVASDRRRELQRLLYVACTRTKGNLVLVRDEVLWKKEKESSSLGSLYGS